MNFLKLTVQELLEVQSDMDLFFYWDEEKLGSEPKNWFPYYNHHIFLWWWKLTSCGIQRLIWSRVGYLMAEQYALTLPYTTKGLSREQYRQKMDRHYEKRMRFWLLLCGGH